MPFESFIARRYLKRRTLSRFLSFMTVVAVGSVAVGTAALIITFSILDGFERELTSNIVRFAAHIQVGTFRDKFVQDDAATRKKLAGIDGVARSSPYLQREAVVITRDNIDGIVVKGVVPGGEITRIQQSIVEGVYDLSASRGGASVVIGKRLAGRLGVGAGDRMVLVGLTSMEALAGAPKIPCRIAGVYETGMAEYFDGVYVFTSLATAQALFGNPGGINGYDVLCTSPEEIELTVFRIQAVLGYPFDPQSIHALYRNLFVWVDLQQQLIPVVVGSLIVISVFNIIATLLLFVIEKTRNTGILSALGAARASIRRIFLYQGLWIGGAGAAIGSAIAFAFCFLQQELQFFNLPQDVYYMNTVPIHLSAGVFLLTAATAVGLSVISSFIPAWLGSRLNPINSIRFH